MFFKALNVLSVSALALVGSPSQAQIYPTEEALHQSGVIEGNPLLSKAWSFFQEQNAGKAHVRSSLLDVWKNLSSEEKDSVKSRIAADMELLVSQKSCLAQAKAKIPLARELERNAERFGFLAVNTTDLEDPQAFSSRLNALVLAYISSSLAASFLASIPVETLSKECPSMVNYSLKGEKVFFAPHGGFVWGGNIISSGTQIYSAESAQLGTDASGLMTWLVGGPRMWTGAMKMAIDGETSSDEGTQAVLSYLRERFEFPATPTSGDLVVWPGMTSLFLGFSNEEKKDIWVIEANYFPEGEKIKEGVMLRQRPWLSDKGVAPKLMRLKKSDGADQMDDL